LTDTPNLTTADQAAADAGPTDYQARSEFLWNGRHLAELSDEELEQAIAQSQSAASGGPPPPPPPPEPLSPVEFARLAVSWPQPKTHITLNLDEDIVAWFRAHGPRYQQRINAVLRAFVDSRASQRTRRSAAKQGE
jgi:uncharacterized protein (DUF4415 family)